MHLNKETPDKYKLLTVVSKYHSDSESSNYLVHNHMIGSTFMLYNCVVGEDAYLECISLVDGSPACGVIETSPVVSLEITEVTIVLSTGNSIYTFEKVENSDEW